MVCYSCDNPHTHVCRGDVPRCDECCPDGLASRGYCSRDVSIDEGDVVELRGSGFTVRVGSEPYVPDQGPFYSPVFRAVTDDHQEKFVGILPKYWIDTVLEKGGS